MLEFPNFGHLAHQQYNLSLVVRFVGEVMLPFSHFSEYRFHDLSNIRPILMLQLNFRNYFMSSPFFL